MGGAKEISTEVLLSQDKDFMSLREKEGHTHTREGGERERGREAKTDRHTVRLTHIKRSGRRCSL